MMEDEKMYYLETWIPFDDEETVDESELEKYREKIDKNINPRIRDIMAYEELKKDKKTKE